MFKRIVFNQFHDLIRQGKDPMKARTNALMLVSVLLLLPLFILFFLNVDWLASHFSDMAQSGISSRFLGKVLGVLLLVSVFGILYLVLGGKPRFERYLAEFYALDEQQRQSESKKGSLYFLIPFFVMLGLVLYLAYAMA